MGVTPNVGVGEACLDLVGELAGHHVAVDQSGPWQEVVLHLIQTKDKQTKV